MAGDAFNQPLPEWVRPETMLFSLFGTYADASAWLPVRAIVQALTTLGLREAAVRMLVSRLKKRGKLRPLKPADTAGYVLTDAGKDAVETGVAQLDNGCERPREWDGEWTVLMFTVPESERAHRDALRARLREMRFGVVGPGAYISAWPLTTSQRSQLEVDDQTSRITIVRGRAIVPGSNVDVVRRAWPDLGPLVDRCGGFVERFAPYASGDAGPGDGRSAFVIRFRCLLEYLELAFEDPRLPASLYPTSWRGDEALTVYRGVIRSLDAVSRAFIQG